MSSASAVRLSPSVQKQKLKLELLRGSRLKLESLPVSVVVHDHLVRAGCMFFGTAMVRIRKTDHFFKLAPFWSPLTDLIDFGMAGKLLTSATR